MKIPTDPRPSRDRLAELPLHAVVRDFPESVAVLRAAGVSVVELGDRKVRDVPGAPSILERLEAAVAWRPPASGERPSES